MKKVNTVYMIALFCAVLLGASLLGGCGNAKKEAGPSGPTRPLVDAEPVGMDVCTNCHSGQTTVWMQGPHGNNETFDFTTYTIIDLGLNNIGFPYYGYEGLGTDPNCTTVCHDQLGDGYHLTAGVTGNTPRPVIGCESCHGGGQLHYGMGPIPYPTPDADRCGQCHNNDFPDDHLAYHPEGDRIAEDYEASKHAASIETHNYVTGSETDVEALCSRCHTDEGAKRYIPVVNGTKSHDEIVAAMNGMPDIPNASVVQCRTCHDGHDPSTLIGERAAGLPVTWSVEFKTCTSCHQLLNAEGAAGNVLHNGYHSPYDAGGNTVNPYGSWDAYLPSTHFDNPATPTRGANNSPVTGTGGIEGYVIQPTATHSAAVNNLNNGTCRDCHNEHGGNMEINRSWARSKHAGDILTIKEDAAAGNLNVYTAAVEPAEGIPIHYFWKDASRAACQRCHTSTGYRNFASNQQGYADANSTPIVTNDFSHLSGEQAELLYCWACHTDNVGGLRNPGAINANYSVITTAGVVQARVYYQYPDALGSNVCMGCHTARENGDSIAVLNTQGLGAANFKNLSFINSHYLAAGGTVFTATGYEFAGRDYTNPAAYEHDQIGTPAEAGTGSNGPCAGCHMSTSESHLFLPVTEDANGTITAVTSTVCSQCHPGGEALSMSPAMLENQKTMLADAIKAVAYQLESKDIYLNLSAYGYFFPLRTNTGTADATAGSNVVTGGGTSWGAVNSGDYFRIDATEAYYTVSSVASANQMTLKTGYAGSTVAAANFTIIKSSAQKDWSAGGDDGSGNITGKNNMGSAFSVNLILHDPGAFAHNRYYTKRLMYDAIDWLDDNIMNYSVGATLNALPAGTAFKANAMTYILVNGTPTGDLNERP